VAGGSRSAARPGWLLDEVAGAGRENLDPDHVALYDEKEDARSSDEVALLEKFGLNDESALVDLGAGTGQLVLAVAPICKRVVAVDVSPVMIERLRAKVAASELSNIEVVQAGFLTYEHQGRPADVVYSRWALHHLPDFWKSVTLGRIRSFVHSGSVVRLSDIVYSFDPSEAEERIEAWCATLPSNPTSPGEWTRGDLEEHIRDEHSTYTWLLEPMLERSGFQIERADYSADGMFAQYIARAM
jgi:SAM-dependent methyltransferase